MFWLHPSWRSRGTLYTFATIEANKILKLTAKTHNLRLAQQAINVHTKLNATKIFCRCRPNNPTKIFFGNSTIASHFNHSSKNNPEEILMTSSFRFTTWMRMKAVLIIIPCIPAPCCTLATRSEYEPVQLNKLDSPPASVTEPASENLPLSHAEQADHSLSISKPLKCLPKVFAGQGTRDSALLANFTTSLMWNPGVQSRRDGKGK